MSQKQVLESHFVLAKYILLSVAPDAQQGVIEPMKEKPGWVSFWKVPSNAFLGDNLRKESYPQEG